MKKQTLLILLLLLAVFPAYTNLFAQDDEEQILDNWNR
jgi:hypothetical protein